ncbi:MAG: hypothetical protein F4106_02805 [Gemmatimonadetes bacterium]|nr:hypothetical protein [Gemmatimonadota bacterium]
MSLSVRRDVRIYQEEEMRLVRRQTILLIGILLLGCSQENSDPPGIYRDQEATEMLRAAQIRGAEIILERSDRLLPLLERGKEHALLLPALERELPQLLLDDRMVANLRLTLEAGRVANADLRDLGIEASGTRSLAFVERQLAEYDRAKQLHAEWRDLTVGTLDWTNRARKLTPENWSEDEFQELDRMLTNLSIKRQRLQREFR